MADLSELLSDVGPEDLDFVLQGLPPHIQAVALEIIEKELNQDVERPKPKNVIEFAQMVTPAYQVRPHLEYLSARLESAIKRVESGESVKITVSIPPRTGKTYTTSTLLPSHILNIHPDWKIGILSHSPDLAANWGRANRRMVETFGAGEGGNGLMPDVELARDVKAVSYWETTRGGSMLSKSVNQALAGYGFKVMIVDDAVKDFASAHNQKERQSLWDWWKTDAITRLEGASLCIVIGTRWHKDDLIGRILSPEHEGNPAEWEQIVFPAIATHDDVIGRKPGDPLLSPLIKDETPEKALARWNNLESSVGSYTWNALYQQNPVSDKGGIFKMDKLRYYTVEPSRAREDGSVVLLDEALMNRWRSGEWLDSWDTAFEGKETSDYVVGQRWVRAGADRFLVAQKREKMDFNATIREIEEWAAPGEEVPWSSSPFGRYVHKRLIENKATGSALISSLRGKIAGIKGVNPTLSKEVRARLITPEIESGNVYVPHPADPGNAWVNDFLSELQGFPHTANDDSVDAFTQALSELRDAEGSVITVPTGSVRRDIGGSSLGIMGRRLGRR